MNYRGPTEALSVSKQEEEKQSSHLDTRWSDLKTIKNLEKNVKEKVVGIRQASGK